MWSGYRINDEPVRLDLKICSSDHARMEVILMWSLLLLAMNVSNQHEKNRSPFSSDTSINAFINNYIFWSKISFLFKTSKSITGRPRPVYFKEPAWPAEALGLACLACARLKNHGLCLSQAGRHRQAGRPNGLF
jgi:hypothetical protein